MNEYISLIMALPSTTPTERMRVWRALKTTGAGVLRDGVYLLPSTEHHRATFQKISAQIVEMGGTAYIVNLEEPDKGLFRALFDRVNDYAECIHLADELSKKLKAKTANEQLKEVRKLRKQFEAIVEIDFFAGESQAQAVRALSDLEEKVMQFISPDEPHAIAKKISLLKIANYQGKVWATRSNLWVDRLACAWLIRSYIDPNAKFLWLKSPKDCPKSALGFDFDGATFTHSGGLVTFEVLVQSFGIISPEIKKLGLIIHALDAGGIFPPEAQGVEMVLSGIKASEKNDDKLLAKASDVFNALVGAFSEEKSK